MAIIRKLTLESQQEAKEIITSVLERRKLEFDIEVILKVIKEELERRKMDLKIMDTSYFQLILRNTLDDYVKNTVLYPMNGCYIPLEYMITKKYLTTFSNLLYLDKDDNRQDVYIDIATGSKTTGKKNVDYLLTGGWEDNNRNTLRVPDVSLQELECLYQDFLREGARKEEAINHILNYYKAEYLSSDEWLPNTMVIYPRKKEVYKKKSLRGSP